MKILGSDYDGTLNYGGIDDEKIEAIQKWRLKGNLFGVVTGRGVDFYQNLTQNFPRLTFDFLVTCNGGYITDGEGELIHETRCDTLPVATFAKDLFQWGCKYIHFNGNGYICLVEKWENIPDYIQKSKACLMREMPVLDYFNQISIQLSSVEEAFLLAQKIDAKYKQWVVPLQNGICIDIVPVGVNKTQGLYRIMEHFGCEYNDVITVGDNLNDTDMIREFRSYAMGNAVEEIRGLANETVSSVTKLIEKELKL